MVMGDDEEDVVKVVMGYDEEEVEKEERRRWDATTVTGQLQL